MFSKNEDSKKNGELIKIEFITLVVLILVGIGSTHYVISKQTDKIVNKVVEKMLQIEYTKVGGIDNYKKLNEIQQKQIEGFLKQYENQKPANNFAPVENNNNNNPTPVQTPEESKTPIKK